MPQLLSFELCQRMKRVLTATDRYPYVDEPSHAQIDQKRSALRALLQRPGRAMQDSGGTTRWWTFAGGRINHTLKYGLEVARGVEGRRRQLPPPHRGNWREPRGPGSCSRTYCEAGLLG